jgi:L-ornithine N5-oxygenase
MLREREAERRKAAIPSSYISSLASTSATPATCLRFAVIGGGQSSAEITLHLKRVFPTSNVQMIFRSSALVPSDDSAFVNSVAFDPSRTDAFWNSSPQARSDWTKEFKRTNYSVVNKVVLNDIYDAVYDQEIQFDQPWPNAAGAAPSNGGHEGLVRLQNNRQVNSVHFNKETQMVELAITSTKKVPVAEEVQSFDAVFLGTGFDRRPTSVPFLEPISTFFPMLDTESTRRKTELGFEEEEETDEIVSELLESQDEYAVEKLRERVRGIARDYRLVNYWSDAFSTTTNSTTSASSGSSSSRSTDGGATPSSSSSSETLNGDGEETTNDKVFEPSVFFLGGNEQTHGLSDSLLSIVAHRAGEVCDSIIKSHTASFRSLGENHHPVDIAKSLQSVAIKCSNASCPLSDDTTAPIAEFTQPQQSV